MNEPIQTPPKAADEPQDEQTDAAPILPAEGDSAPSKDAPTATPAPTLDVWALTDRALRFLATASNETLGACLVGLGAGTYLVLGRVGLILIGVVGGVVLHATWEGHAPRNGDKTIADEGRKREIGIDVARRVLDWRETVSQGKEKESEKHSDTDLKLYAGKELDFSDFRPETAAALTELTDAVIRDYVKWWYSPILPTETSFPQECRRTLTAFLISVSNHLSRKRPADSLVDFVTRSSSFMIIFFQELSGALAASPGAPVPEAVDTYLQYKPDSPLGSILDTQHQGRQFENAADDILQSYLDPKTYNCKPAQVFLRQMLAKVVLEMIVVSCSKPEWINGWIVYLLEDGEPELMHAIDAGVEGSSGQFQNARRSVEKQTSAETPVSPEQKNRERAMSRAQDAMDEAMREAQRLSQMIAEEDARKLRDLDSTSSSTLIDDKSESTTQGIVTPTSSQSDTIVENEARDMALPALASQSGAISSTSLPEEAPKEVKRPFTSFDQIIPQSPPTALMANPLAVEKPPPLTLHNCKVVILDDAPGDKSITRNKPTAEYLIQIEPSSNHYSGWMTLRKYDEFQSLHETLRPIAAITGSTEFTEAHTTLPAWKGHTKSSFRGELERYLNDAVRYKSLAECDKMKRFLERDAQMGRSPGSKGPFGWPGQTFETMGKGMFDVLSKAPKEVAGGGKAHFGGVTGVLGSVTTPLGAKKGRTSVSSGSPTPSMNASRVSASSTSTPVQTRHGRAESTVSELPTHIRSESTMSSFTRRTSTESIRSTHSPIIDQQPQREAPMERRPSTNPDGDGKRSSRSSVYGASRSNSRAPSMRNSMDLSPAMGGDQILNLPPMPSDIPDDYTTNEPIRTSLDPFHSRHPSRASTTSLSLTNEPVPPLPRRQSATSLHQSKTQSPGKPTSIKEPKSHATLSEQETTVLIDLFFALTTELYSLSSAWGIRLTLLSAAKSFLLRPGNPQLTSIQTLLQSTVLDANSSDSAIALHLKKMRENSLPTEEELKAWPKEMSEEEKEALRVKARKLLVERGMPMALTSVMGNVATGEALGRVFDALQMPSVARGVMFGLVVQGLRGVVQ